MPEKFRAPEALEMGLVSAVVAPDELLGLATRKALQAASYAPLTFASIKANLNDGEHIGFPEALDREADRHVRSGMTEDARVAARAFLEKRPGVFQGR